MLQEGGIDRWSCTFTHTYISTINRRSQLDKIADSLTSPASSAPTLAPGKRNKSGWPDAEEFKKSGQAAKVAELIVSCVHSHPGSRPTMEIVVSKLGHMVECEALVSSFVYYDRLLDY